MKKLVVVLLIGVAGFISWTYYRYKQRPDWTRSETSTIADAYYLKAYRNGRFIFVHKGQMITAKCRRTLTWLKGNNQEGEPMAQEGECTYITPDQVGKYFGDDLTYVSGTELSFYPWQGEPTTQTADILDIESFELQTEDK